MLNLWNPGHVGLLLALPTAFLLGMTHGVTPDEHTWPITFSYSVGSYSSRGGRRAGFLFSAAFTLQRALASELAFLALSSFEFSTRWEYFVYLVVGGVMVASGLYILRRGKVLHLGHVHGPEEALREPRALPTYMPLVHGFIAGWGVGAFAIIVYTVLAPQMGSAWIGWVPGALFGLGTMVMQVLLGSIFGAWMARRRMSDDTKRFVAQKMSGRTLAGGGIAFLLVALAGIVWPTALSSWSIATPLHVHNLHNLGTGFVLAVPVLFGVAIWAFVSSTREAARRAADQEQDSGPARTGTD